VALGYTQSKGLDYDSTFSPVARLKSLRMMHGLAVLYNMKLYTWDVETAFLNGLLESHVEIYMKKEKKIMCGN